MGAVWLCARNQLRGWVLAGLVLALLVGLAGGIALAALAGAHRSDTALARFLTASDTVNLMVVWDSSVELTNPTDRADELAAVAALPQVRTAQRVAFVILSGSDPTGPADPSRQIALVGLDRPGHEALGRPLLVAGRWPRPDHPEEALVDEEFASRYDLHADEPFRVGTYTRAQFGQAAGGVFVPPKGPTADLRVAGIVRFPKDLLPLAEGRSQTDTDQSGDLYLTPGFWRRYGPDLARWRINIAVELHRPADLPMFAEAVEDRFGRQAAFVSPTEALEESDVLFAGVRRAIAVETAAMLLFAVLALLSTVLLVSQTLGRQVFLASTQDPTLRALGMTRRQLVGVALTRAAVIGTGGAALAIVAAVALSPFTPIGVARLAEPTPGVAVDWPVLTVGGLVIVALVAGCAALPAWRAAHTSGDALGVMDLAGPRRPSRLAGTLAGVGLLTAALGMRLALEPGRGRTAVPVRAALAGTVAAVCAVTAAASFGASLTHLVATPPAYGVTWDLAVGSFDLAATAEPVAKRLVSHPEVAAAAARLGAQDMWINGQAIPVLAIEPRKGSLPLAVVEGREPTSPDEIALGSTTLRSLGKQVGDSVIVGGPWGVERLRVVGRAVLLHVGWSNWTSPGKGGIVHPEFLHRLPISVWPHTFLVRLDPARDRDQAIARLRRDFPGAITVASPPAEVRDLQRISQLPALLATLVALVALATVTHVLVTSVRRRRRDLAILKTLGFLRGQVAATIAWQATTFAVIALGLGIPLGVAAGRWSWRLITSQLGVASVGVVPLPAIIAVAAGSILAANLIAAVPGWAAGHLRPATALRSE
jgi:hypothetical protein